MSLTTGQVKIGSTILKNLKTVEPVLGDLDKDSTRTALGRLIRNRAARIPQLKLLFAPQNKADMESLLGLLSTASFSVTYYLPHSTGEKTANFYAGNHEPKIIRKDPVLYDEMEVNLIGFEGI